MDSHCLDANHGNGGGGPGDSNQDGGFGKRRRSAFLNVRF